MADELLPPREVAEELGVTVRTVQRWIAAGRLPARRVGGRLRVSRAALATVAATAAPMAAGPIMAGPIRALLVANRGEIAARVARTARRLGIRVVGVHTRDERPPDGVDAARVIGSYLDADELIKAALEAGADAIHPGYGFLAESPGFADAVTAAGLRWVGPSGSGIAAMGDKAAARRLVAAHGVPVLPGYDGPAQDDATLGLEAARIGYPLLVKPSAGGGGKGMRVVRDRRDLPDALAGARREARGAFGDDRLILERLVERGRHVEVQVLFDAHGSGVHLGERDCSAQRRHQKILEEAPAPSVTPELRTRMGAAALAAAAAVGYVNAGTVEFLLAEDGSFAFIEMNTRLQVEHPVTEAVTGRDLVAEQLRVAAGERLGFTQEAMHLRGHAIEARIYAEDPEAGFLPAGGTIAGLAWPEGAGIRIDAGVQPGDTVSDRYDPMLAKLIAHGPDRAEALARLRGALASTSVLGVRTNLRFLRWLVEQPAARDGDLRTDTLDSLRLPAPGAPPDDAWTAAAAAMSGAGLLPTDAWGGGWRLNAAARIRMVSGEHERSVPLPSGAGAETHRSAVDAERGLAFVDDGGQSIEFRLGAPPSVEEASRHATAHEGTAALAVSSPMPGRVIAVRVVEGDEVDAHRVLVVIEAMKMEHAVTAPAAGRISRLAAHEGQQIQRGDLLAEVTPYHGADDGA